MKVKISKKSWIQSLKVSFLYVFLTFIILYMVNNLIFIFTTEEINFTTTIFVPLLISLALFIPTLTCLRILFMSDTRYSKFVLLILPSIFYLEMIIFRIYNYYRITSMPGETKGILHYLLGLDNPLIIFGFFVAFVLSIILFFNEKRKR